MNRVLVVVESPTKAKTIKKYLGSGYTVKASVGHVRDLPQRDLGIDIEKGFEPNYVTVKGKAKVLKELKQAAKDSRAVLLATDMDREGEAIAWHLFEMLKAAKIPIRRIVFNEITKRALDEALKDPRDIDLDKVNAQQARRVLDRLVGYLISPVLWKIFYRGLSAGRVQTVGLRLICEREREIRGFVPREYWTIEGTLETSRGEAFAARLLKIDGKKPEIPSREESDRILQAIRDEKLLVSDIVDREKVRNPQPPFITSTLQREAASRFGFSAKKTMTIAQQLYEGVELGPEGSVALVSYMRTDSVRISEEAHRQGTQFLEESFGKDILPSSRKNYRAARLAQDAHEAIRPTDVRRVPDQVKKFLSKDQYTLYRLIWERFLASIAAPAVYAVREVDIAAGKRFVLRASGRKLLKKGFLAIAAEDAESNLEWLPELERSEELSIRNMDALQHFTEPPPRYTEASLIKELEEKGIGRPSTYATILGIIQARDYVRKKGGALYPTELGEKVWNMLNRLFRDIFEIDFTARMELQLDKVEEARANWRDVVRMFYEPLAADLASAKERRAEIKNIVQEESQARCEICGRKLVKKWGRNGAFLACPAFPECRYTRPLEEEEKIERKCPKCGSELSYKNGRFGKFIACTNYPKCKYTEAITLDISCPREGCTGKIGIRRTKRGKIFYGCSNYPECSYASWDKPTDKICPKCSKSYLVEKESKKKGRYLRCPECGHEVLP